MPAPEHEQLHAVVHGRVQGVNFRYYTVREATTLGLTGWVRNRRDGTVEVLAEGPRAQLDRLHRFLRHGPPSALVTGVEASWGLASGDYHTFEVRYGGTD